MNDAPRNAPNSGQPQPHGGEFASDQAVESAALAGAAAIQRLVAERNSLRNHVGAQQRELAALRAVNEDLRRRLVLIHKYYVELGKRVVGQLEQFDGTIRDIVQEAHDGAAHGEETQPPASLVRRLAETAPPESARPNGADPESA